MGSSSGTPKHSGSLLRCATEGRPGDLSDADRAFLYARALVLTLHHSAELLAAHGIEIPSDAVTALTSGFDTPPEMRRPRRAGAP